KPYLWPLNAPNGIPLTRAWPLAEAGKGGSTDHPHHKSAWFCHGDVIPEGLELKARNKGVRGVDFWSESPGHGQIVVVEAGKAKSHENHAWIPTRNEWRSADGTTLLHEERILHLYDLGKAHLIVLDIDLRAGAYAITFGDTKEGSLGVRVRD